MAPNVLGRLSALTGRMTQSLLDPTEARMHIYVDDPCTTIKGTPARRKRIVTIICIFWLAINWGLSMHKAQQGPKVSWIGFGLSVTDLDVAAEIKEDSMKDFRKLLAHTRRQRWISVQSLRSFAGKSNHIAKLLFSWRPFLTQLWGASSNPEKATAPEGGFGSSRSALHSRGFNVS